MTDNALHSLNLASDAPDDPIALFKQWLEEAEKTEEHYPNAMCVSTVDENGKPSARIILLKKITKQGFIFFTNQKSKKAKDLQINPYANLNFYWKMLGRQVNISGSVSTVTDQEADDYFSTRPRDNQIGAWASQQSKVLDERKTFNSRIQEYKKIYEGKEVIRPDYWSGYCVHPEKIEFWYEGEYRLHTRLLYSEAEGKWRKELLYP